MTLGIRNPHRIIQAPVMPEWFYSLLKKFIKSKASIYIALFCGCLGPGLMAVNADWYPAGW